MDKSHPIGPITAKGRAKEPAHHLNYKDNISSIEKGLYHLSMQRDIASFADLKSSGIRTVFEAGWDQQDYMQTPDGRKLPIRWDPNLPVFDFPAPGAAEPSVHEIEQEPQVPICFDVEEARDVCICTCGAFMSFKDRLKEHRRLGHFDNGNIPKLKIFCPGCAQAKAK